MEVHHHSHMEVHHHSHPDGYGDKRKKGSHYFWEFVRVFL